MTEPKGGRTEVLTLELALKICRLIERMPDADIPVTWNNVMLHVKKQFGHTFRRNVLSQKTWDGKRLLAVEFNKAKAVQKRKSSESTPKYTTSARSVLQKHLADLEAKILVLQEELERTRAMQYDQLDSFRATRVDLRAKVEQLQEKKS